MAPKEAFLAAIPRSNAMDGSDLRIIDIGSAGEVFITDGMRIAAYVPMLGRALLGAHLRIEPHVETGWFGEASAVLLNDGRRNAVYVAVSLGGVR